MSKDSKATVDTTQQDFLEIMWQSVIGAREAGLPIQIVIPKNQKPQIAIILDNVQVIDGVPALIQAEQGESEKESETV